MAVLTVLSLLCAVFALSLATDLNGAEKRASCDSEWSSKGNRCFKFFSDSKTWPEAETECVKNGGHLASIHNSDEARFVGELARTQTFWIGGAGGAESFTWFWTDGTPFDYSNWNKWEPNNHGENEHCIHTNFEREVGVWNDYFCDAKYPYVCAK